VLREAMRIRNSQIVARTTHAMRGEGFGCHLKTTMEKVWIAIA
jgi:hypothetical protein